MTGFVNGSCAPHVYFIHTIRIYNIIHLNEAMVSSKQRLLQALIMSIPMFCSYAMHTVVTFKTRQELENSLGTLFKTFNHSPSRLDSQKHRLGLTVHVHSQTSRAGQLSQVGCVSEALKC